MSTLPLPHVLLIDPSDTREVLAERIRMQGYVVTACADPAEGALAALSEPPAIVVADLWMSGISGVQLCRLLRSEPATETVPVVLRGPDQSLRDRFWAERAGAVAYVGKGRMGALVRALAAAIAASPPQGDGFFTQLAGGELDLRDRIASHLDAALFESVIASEVRALGVCGTFARLLDLLAQLCVQVASYRWMAVYTPRPERFGLHAHPGCRAVAEAEARAALGIAADVAVSLVEDEDAFDHRGGPPALVQPITLGAEGLGRFALAPVQAAHPHDSELVRVVARELGGPIRISTLMEDLKLLALADPLTGLRNRRAFVADARREISRFERVGAPLSVLLLDVDHFKIINDRRGHNTGDAVLAALGRLLPTLVRQGDLLGRWGGEEFVVALPGATECQATERAEKIRVAIAALEVLDGKGELTPVTASIGVAACLPGDDVGDLVGRADGAMYVAKSSGRNRVVAATPLAPAQERQAS